MPSSEFAHVQQMALNALKGGKVDKAIGLAQRMIKLAPNDSDGHFLLGIALDQNNRVKEAIGPIETALQLKESAENQAHYARLLTRQKRLKKAAVAAERAIKLGPKDGLTLDTIGCVYSQLGNHTRAVSLFEKAVSKSPENLQFRFNLATSQQFLGNFEEAEKHYEYLINIEPNFSRAHAALSALRTQTSEKNHIDRLNTVLRKTTDLLAQLHLRYALAKEYEDIGQYDDAFAQLKQANSERKALLGYSIETDRRLFNEVKDAYSNKRNARENISAEQVVNNPVPIFVVGMPRTGTTLVDRILSTHAEVESAGELQTMPVLIKELSRSKTRVVLDEDVIKRATAIDVGLLGARYMEETESQRIGRRWFVDKLPLNFFNVGLITQALPQAKIVCLRRDPMDTVWSNFKHLFAVKYSFYNYSYDVKDTAEYVSLFNDLMDYWDCVLPGKIVHLKYEQLVSDFESQVRGLLENLGLTWSESCLHFNRNNAAVATPSAVQVRSPVYASSVGRWRHVQKHLTDAVAFFDQNGITYEKVFERNKGA